MNLSLHKTTNCVVQRPSSDEAKGILPPFHHHRRNEKR
jgi:hypothetical protein